MEKRKEEGKGCVDEVAPASYTSAKSAVVIRVREAAFRARPEGEARFAKSTTAQAWPERRGSEGPTRAARGADRARKAPNSTLDPALECAGRCPVGRSACSSAVQQPPAPSSASPTGCHSCPPSPPSGLAPPSVIALISRTARTPAPQAQLPQPRPPIGCSSSGPVPPSFAPFRANRAPAASE